MLSGAPVVVRSAEEKRVNPERLNLDRRNLTVWIFEDMPFNNCEQMCPILEGEHRLRLLNYQNNAITEISNVDNLPDLIFLDLYNNQITVYIVSDVSFSLISFSEFGI